MTAPTGDRRNGHAARRPGEAPANRRTPPRVVAFALLCAASLALAVGYAWWSAARQASFVRDVSLPPIDSLAEVDPPGATARTAPLAATPGAELDPPGATARTAPPSATPGAELNPPGATARTAPPSATPGDSGTTTPAARPPDDRSVLLRHTGLDESFGVASVERVDAAGGGRRATPLRCDRVDFAGERGVCLTTDRFYTTHAIMVFDGAFEPLHRLPLHGVPSRVRLAPDGRLAAVTVFVSGHSYLDEGFSTETSIVDTYSGERRIANLEELQVYRDGAPFRAIDFNFWGVTFAADGDRFYATLGTGGTTYLVEGRVSTRRADVVAEGVECPSLSPDQSRLVFKKRLPLAAGLGWRLHVMHLGSRAVTPLAELRSVDDQAEWLDDSTVLYAIPDPTAPRCASKAPTATGTPTGKPSRPAHSGVNSPAACDTLNASSGSVLRTRNNASSSEPRNSSSG